MSTRLEPRHCCVKGCPNQDAKHGAGLCWAHLKRRERGQDFKAPVQTDQSGKPVTRIPKVSGHPRSAWTRGF